MLRKKTTAIRRLTKSLIILLLIVGCEETLEPEDCAGVAGGTAGLDSCAVCVSGTTNLTACTQDCAEDWGGIAVLDSCGTCDADITNDCEKDCADVWGGGAVVDECGVCGGDGIPDGDCDCDGNVENMCGDCGTPMDECGVCYGDGSSCTFDIDGNIYQNVLIGEQIWLAENLKVKHYNNGDEIPTGYSNYEWIELETGAYAVYDNDPQNADTYGNLYNWYAVDDDRGVCPEGFHIPSEYEWIELEIFMGISESEANSIGWRGTDEGGRLKSTGTIEGGDGLWNIPNEGATNESGFTALPGGGFSYDFFSYMSYYCIFWSTTVSNSNFVWTRIISYSSSQIGRDDDFTKQPGLSVRCLED